MWRAPGRDGPLPAADGWLRVTNAPPDRRARPIARADGAVRPQTFFKSAISKTPKTKPRFRAVFGRLRPQEACSRAPTIPNAWDIAKHTLRHDRPGSRRFSDRKNRLPKVDNLVKNRKKRRNPHSATFLDDCALKTKRPALQIPNPVGNLQRHVLQRVHRPLPDPSTGRTDPQIQSDRTRNRSNERLLRFSVPRSSQPTRHSEGCPAAPEGNHEHVNPVLTLVSRPKNRIFAHTKVRSGAN